MTVKVFVDGQSGTTGLEIHQRLSEYRSLELLDIDPADRKDPIKKRAVLNAADIVFLCLPDDAALESVALIDNPRTKVIDASTAHRCHPDWVYGLPELSPEQRSAVAQASRVAVTGCHAAAAILAIKPLMQAGLLNADRGLVLQSITGYSGGGKAMIADYEEHAGQLASPRPYGLQLRHKHLPEIMRYTGLTTTPIFVPIVAHYYQGLSVQVPLQRQWLAQSADIAQVHAAMTAYYRDEPGINVLPLAADSGLVDGFFDIEACNGTNRVDLALHGTGDQMVILSRLDNLGKGASGAAIQCMNLMLGYPEWQHLSL